MSRGQNLTIEAEGEVLEEIEEGAYVILNIKWGVITVYNKRVDFCEQLKHVNETCPLKKGAMKINKDIAIPQEVPPVCYILILLIFEYLEMIEISDWASVNPT